MSETFEANGQFFRVDKLGNLQKVIPGFEGSMVEGMRKIRREMLSKFLTNVDGPVTALWGRVPPVLAAALTARQSRVAERDVAQVLWDEFLSLPDIGEELLMRAIKDDEGLDEYLAGNKARKMIKRILDGYGDDSVREDASAWVFFREFPVLSTLEMFRHPLLTGIEASTRYIKWSDKVDGRYMYVFPEGLNGTKYEGLVRETIDGLFETYGKLWPKVWEYVAFSNPRGAGQSEVAWKTAIHGRVCDDLRTLIPLSAMTNGGIHANFRTLSEVIMDLRASDSLETRRLADMITTELVKINPEFVAVVDDEHGIAWAEYKKSLAKVTRQFVGAEVEIGLGGKEVLVRILNQDYRRDLMAGLILSQRPGLTDEQLELALVKVKGSFDQYLSQLGQVRTNRRHKVPDFFEVVSLLVSFRRLTFGAAKDLNRHRKRNMQSEFDWSGVNGWDVPADIGATDWAVMDSFNRAQRKSILTYHEVARDYPVEARSILTHGMYTKFALAMGLGEAFWISELRTIASGNPEYRRLAQLLWKELEKLIPELSEIGSFVNMNEYSLGRIKEAVRQDLKGKK